MPKITICIPTYWTGESRAVSVDRLVNIYDHPTPINHQGTLERALVSLSNIEGDFNVAIIGTITEPELEDVFQTKLKKMLSKIKNLDLYWFSFNELAAFHSLLDNKGNSHQKKYLSLEGYSNIRNLCLVLPRLLGSDLAVLIDDDEVFSDKDFIKKATEFIGDEVAGKKVLAKSGFYIWPNEEEKKRIPWWELSWPKTKTMEQMFANLKDGPRLNEAPFALGGAMVVHKDLFSQISFDPWAVRGEDIDYLINSKLHGYQFFTDNELNILHLPPKEFGNPLLGMRQDIYRFIYEQEKLNYAFKHTDLKRFDLKELDPYPGTFLRSGVGARALGLSLATGRLKLVKTAVVDAKRYAKRNKSRWFGFQRLWPAFMEEITDIDAGKVLTKIN